MAQSPTFIHNPDQVDVWMESLNPAQKSQVNILRKIILDASELVGEHVKWNSPAYFLQKELPNSPAKSYSRDIVVMHLRKKNPMLIFPSAALLPDPENLNCENQADGRKIITIPADITLETAKESIQNLIKNWIEISIAPNSHPL